MNTSMAAQNSCPSDDPDYPQRMLSTYPGSCDEFCSNQDLADRPDRCVASSHCAYCPTPVGLAFFYPPRFPLENNPRYGCRPVNVSATTGAVFASDYSPANNGNYLWQRGLVATACGWQAFSGNLSRALNMNVTFRAPVRGNGTGTPVPVTNRCASLSPAMCAFSSACILCGNSSNPGVGLVCAAFQPSMDNYNIPRVCQTLFGREDGIRGGIMHYNYNQQFTGYNSLMAIYPSFCSAIDSFPTPGTACALSMGVCGWCKDRSKCVRAASPGSASPFYPENCTETVNFERNFLYSGEYGPQYYVTAVQPEASCLALTTATDCLASPFCGWCPVPPFHPTYGLMSKCMPFQPGYTGQGYPDYPVGNGYTCYAGFTPGGPGAVVRPVTCGDIASSVGCAACVNATALYGDAIADGPCGFCSTGAGCFAGTAAGPVSRAATPSYYTLDGGVCPLAPESWRFGASNVDAVCGVDPCTLLTSCESCSTTYSLGCRWCLGSNTCVGSSTSCPANGVYLSRLYYSPYEEPASSTSITQCPGFCAARTDCASCQVGCSFAIVRSQCSIPLLSYHALYSRSGLRRAFVLATHIVFPTCSLLRL